MHQQINLFQPVFRKERKVFSALALAQVVAVVLVAVLAAAGYLRWELHRAQGTVDRMERQHQALAARIAELQRAADPDTAALDRHITALEEELQVRRELRAALEGLMSAGDGGVADTFAALARQRMPGLWLTGLRLEPGTGMAELKGAALGPRLVPEFLHRLPQEPAFQHVDFHTVQLTRNGDEPRQVDFVLQAGYPGGRR